jgi:hypothetical protein
LLARLQLGAQPGGLRSRFIELRLQFFSPDSLGIRAASLGFLPQLGPIGPHLLCIGPYPLRFSPNLLRMGPDMLGFGPRLFGIAARTLLFKLRGQRDNGIANRLPYDIPYDRGCHSPL